MSNPNSGRFGNRLTTRDLPSTGFGVILAGKKTLQVGQGGERTGALSSSSTCKCLLTPGQESLELFPFNVESFRKGTPRKVRAILFVCSEVKRAVWNLSEMCLYHLHLLLLAPCCGSDIAL